MAGPDIDDTAATGIDADDQPTGSDVDVVDQQSSEVAESDSTIIEVTDDTVVVGRRKRLDKGLIVACLVIACGLALIAWGVGSALTGTDGVDRPVEIENLSPVENAIQVLQQGNVAVDLVFGYEAVLVIDGIELETSRLGEVRTDVEPGQQQTTDPTTAVFDPGNARISFLPSEGAPIETFTEGRHTAQVIYWKIEDGRTAGSETYRWSFDVI